MSMATLCPGGPGGPGGGSGGIFGGAFFKVPFGGGRGSHSGVHSGTDCIAKVPPMEALLVDVALLEVGPCCFSASPSVYANGSSGALRGKHEGISDACGTGGASGTGGTGRNSGTEGTANGRGVGGGGAGARGSTSNTPSGGGGTGARGNTSSTPSGGGRGSDCICGG